MEMKHSIHFGQEKIKREISSTDAEQPSFAELMGESEPKSK
jgi:hypothetical protein